MIKQTKCNVVLIDSGISSFYRSKECVTGINIDKSDIGYTIDDNINDNIGHGTCMYKAIRTHNKKANIYCIRILSNNDSNVEISTLTFALNYIYENISCDIINISLSIYYHDDNEELQRLKEICNKLLSKEVIIVSAFDNAGGISYPAMFESVIGVTSGEQCKSIYDIEYVNNRYVNICAKGDPQTFRIDSDRVLRLEGNSLACAHVTGIISDFYQKGMDLYDVMNELKKISIASHSMPIELNKGLPSQRLWDIKKAVIITFGKEIHSLLRYEELLEFEIVGIYDVKHSNNIGRNTNDILNNSDLKNRSISDITEIIINSFDTAIIGHINSLINNPYARSLLNDFVIKCRNNNKKIYSFDELNCYYDTISKSDYFCPKVTKNENAYSPFGKLYDISNPVIGVFGTSSVQGKYTLQLELRTRFTNNGYRIGQIGTEPTALLFNMDYCFPFGFNSNVDITGSNVISYINYCCHTLSGCDAILVGCQSKTAPTGCDNLEQIPLRQIEFLLATQPDCVLLCANLWDDTNYILKTIALIESLSLGKVIGIGILPVERHVNENGLTLSQSVNQKQFEKIISQKFSCLKQPIFNIGNHLDMDKLFTTVINELT